jgi:hypothetical protein
MRAAAFLAVAGLAAAGCTTGIELDPGLDADLRVAGATFYRGAPPAADPDGPVIDGIDSSNNQVYVGQAVKKIGGRMTGDSRAVALYFEGDAGYWVVPAGLPDPVIIGDLQFSASLGFARTIDDGPRDLKMQAITGDPGEEVFGPPETLTLTIKPSAPVASTTLDIQLLWDSQADLDLHVTEPDGITIWARNINSYVPPAPGGTGAGDPADGGILDFDSNSSCVLDGRREENVYWTATPPSGHYLVKVDTWSLCDAPAAHWHVAAMLGDQVVGQASGVGLTSDAQFEKQANAGVLALELDVP